MSGKKSKPVIESDSEVESESASDQTKTNFGEDSDDDSNNFDDRNEKLASSTRIEVNSNDSSKTQVKLELVKKLRDLSIAKLKIGLATKRVPWKSIEVDGYTAEELSPLLKEIIKNTPTNRTLSEILADYEVNYKRYERKVHPDYPLKPKNVAMLFFHANREKFKKQMLKNSPGSEPSYMELFKYAMAKYSKLSEEKREPYNKQVKESYAEYNEKIKAFFKTHPELKTSKSKRKPKVSNDPKPPKVKKGKEGKPPKSPKAEKPRLLTPLSLFQAEISKDGNLYKKQETLKMWKELPDNERAKYISEVFSSKSDQEKRVTSTEMKFLEAYNGLPKRPLSAYNLYVQSQKGKYSGSMINSMRTISETWKNISEKQRDELSKESARLTEKWRKQMEAYIRTLPEDQQPMMFSKHKIYQAHKRINKEDLNSSSDEKVNDNPVLSDADSDDDGSNEDIQPPKKKQRTNGEHSKEKVEKSLSNKSTHEVSQYGTKSEVASPKKKSKKISESSQEFPIADSPKKNGKKNQEVSQSNMETAMMSEPTSPKKKSKKTSVSSQEILMNDSPKKNGKKTQEMPQNNTETSTKSEILSPQRKSKKISESSDSESSQSVSNAELNRRKPQEPEYPSQTTAHYFMTKVFDGKPSKVAKAYKKLDLKQKKKLKGQTKSLRLKFLMSAKLYIGSLDVKRIAAFKRKIDETKAKQKEMISWHVSTGTDNETDSSNDSDSDSL